MVSIVSLLSAAVATQVFICVHVEAKRRKERIGGYNSAGGEMKGRNGEVFVVAGERERRSAFYVCVCVGSRVKLC